MNEDYITRINELQQRIEKIKSVECVMDYDSKTELIEKIKNMMASMANTEAMMMSAGMMLQTRVQASDISETK